MRATFSPEDCSGRKYSNIELTTICEKNITTMESDLKMELQVVKNMLKLKSDSVLKQHHKLLNNEHVLLDKMSEAANERRLRQDQLAIVIRSLILLESRLTREQKQIESLLQQKDKIIKYQDEELSKLRKKKLFCNSCQQLVGFTSEQTNVETDPELQSLDSMDSRFPNTFLRSCSFVEKTQQQPFQKNSRLSKSFQFARPSVVNGNTSSSEDGINSAEGTYVKNKQVFARKDVVRRSRKYSSRKHNSKYLDSVQKNSSSHANSSGTEDVIEKRNNDDNIQKASLRIDRLIQENTRWDKNTKQSDLTYASKMESMHGIRRQQSATLIDNRAQFLNSVLNEKSEEKPWYVNNSDPEQEQENTFLKFHNKSKSADNLLATEFSNGILTAEIISAKNDILCKHLDKSGTGKTVKDRKNHTRKNMSFTEASHENWYISGGSEQDETKPTEIYKNNPVLECVNQILLQNSLDESSNETSKTSDQSSPKSSSKRVQFSTLNSISFDNRVVKHKESDIPKDNRRNRIVKFSLETASEHSYEVPNTAQGYIYEIQSIYSNEYEPIVTNNIDKYRPTPLPRTITTKPNIQQHNQSDNNPFHLYTHVDSNSDSVLKKAHNKKKLPRTPPALPPKPKNLVSKFKFDKGNNKNTSDNANSEMAVQQHVPDVMPRKINLAPSLASVEPDYCSISEINVPVVTNGKRNILLTEPSVEIHNEQYPIFQTSTTKVNSVAKVVPLPRIQTKIDDEDIPKLPQVTEIIIPNDDQANNILNPPQSHINLESRKPITIGHSISNILSEIEKGVRGEKLNVLHELSSPTKADVNHSHTEENIDKFDLSQNFEEFKIDDLIGIGAEEYRISSSSSDGDPSDIVETKLHNNGSYIPSADVIMVENIVNHNKNIGIKLDCDSKLSLDQLEDERRSEQITNKMLNKPDLLSNIDNLNVDTLPNSDLESSNSSGSNSGSYNTVKCEPSIFLKQTNGIHKKDNLSFDCFLESSGLSSKSIISSNPILRFQRPPSAKHQNVMKLKDGKVKNSIIDKPMTAIKYFEPYL